MNKIAVSLIIIFILIISGCSLVDRAPAPTGVNATQGRYVHVVILTWNAVSGAESYNVYYSLSEDGEYSYVGNTADSGAMLGPTGVTYGEHYYYKVAALNVSGSKGERSSAAEGWTGSTSGYTKMYWSDEISDTIDSAQPNGKSISTFLDTGLSQVHDIAIDQAADKIYFTDEVTNAIYSYDLDMASPVDTLPATADTPIGIALDVGNNKLYWADNGTGSIRYADLDGTNDGDFLIGLADPIDIAIDTASGFIYWTDGTDDVIYRTSFPVAGSVVPLIATYPNPWGIALDTANGKLFYSENGSAGNGRVSWANVDGSDAEVLWGDLNDVRGVAVDESDGMLFFADEDKMYRRDIANGLTEVLFEGRESIYAIAFD